MKITKEQNDRRNALTAPEHYKRCNIEIMDAYIALHPSSWSKLSSVLFNIIMDTKMHYQPNHRYYSRSEDKRIFNNKYITLEDILDRCHSVKYGADNKPMANDLSNLMGRLQELDDNNIFYIWKFNKPFTYMFVMERDIGVWKYFNPIACVTPRTLKKIVGLSNNMIDSMMKFEKTKGRKTYLKEVEKSFVNEFLLSIIEKMNPEVSVKIPRWSEGENISEYLTKLRDLLNLMDDSEGLEHDDLFIKRLPKHLQEKIECNVDENQEKESKAMNTIELSNQLIPKNDNLMREKKTRVHKQKFSSTDALAPKKITFTALDPFSNCNNFIRYYKEVIKTYNSDAKFYPPDTERVSATKIMDLLVQNGKSDDSDFLSSWIRYYIQSYLQGNNVYKKERTSLENFQKTFQTYEGKYFRG
jgi:hypothetical protein